MSDNHEKYLMVSSVKELFDSVDNQSIIGFITEAHFYRTTAMISAVYAVVVCVCLSHSSIVSKRLNVVSRK